MRSLSLVALALAAACGGSHPPPPTPPPLRPAPTPPPPAVPAPAAALPLPANVPDTAAGHALAWVLDCVQHPEHATKAAVEAHFSPKFLAQVPTDQTIAVFGQMAKQVGSLTIDLAAPAGDERLLAHASAGDTKLVIHINVVGPQHQIEGLLFQPDVGPKPATMAEALERAAKVAPKTQLLLASVDGGTCKPLYKIAPTEQLALGSATKLYILLGLADQIIAGKLTWDQELAVKDEWKSLPSGITQDDAAGTKLTVKTLAERMISISDNTATDHLLYTVGRTNVEHALAEAKHSKASLDIPFMGTRELFLLKLGTPADMDAYVKLSPAKRRTLLDKTFAGKRADMAGVESWKAPRHITDIEWFASSEDLCRLMTTLQARAKNPKAAPLLDVLSKNPGLPISKTDFPFIGFKGGSEPGVLNLTFLLRRADGKWFFAQFGWNAPEGEISESEALAVATGAIDLLAKEK